VSVALAMAQAWPRVHLRICTSQPCYTAKTAAHREHKEHTARLTPPARTHSAGSPHTSRMSHNLSPVRVPSVLMLAPAWVRMSALLLLLVSVLESVPV